MDEKDVPFVAARSGQIVLFTSFGKVVGRGLPDPFVKTVEDAADWLFRKGVDTWTPDESLTSGRANGFDVDDLQSEIAETLAALRDEQ